jgi:Fe-S-cluster-containing dehydrogenase component
MTIKRRDFLKGIAGGAALSILPDISNAQDKVKSSPEAVGILYDATLCIGCQACMVACKKANDMPYEHQGPLPLWDNPVDLSSKTLNIIKKYENGNKRTKDSMHDGYSFIKRHCMHCFDPACVSACPASAMTKDKLTGIVSYNKDACIGCRYCQVACPFNIPKFEWDKPFPQIFKCQMCSHLISKGIISACCNACPTGASLFGPVIDLYAEAQRRLKMTPGEYFNFPVASVSSGKIQSHKAAKYIRHIYGETESGGTQVLLMSGVPFDLIGLPNLPDRSYASLSENIQHMIYKSMILPVAVLGGLAFIVAKNSKNDE